MLPFSTLLHISRPRFWHYVLGPILIFFASIYIFGYIYQDFLDGKWGEALFPIVIVIGIVGYFSFPANLWIYGRNDIADADTDSFSTKKGHYESKVLSSPDMIKKLRISILGWNIGYIILGSLLWAMLFGFEPEKGVTSFFFVFYGTFTLFFFSVAPFLLISYLYSCKPLRAKARPFLDGIFNMLYIITPSYLFMVLSYVNGTPFWSNFFASLFRCMAMHCYSAIPDIEADSQAGLNTTAVYLGKQKSLIYCIILYLLSAILSFPTLGWFSIVAGIVYMSMMVISYTKKDIFGLYKMFPWINLVVGFCLFWYIILINH